jgi:hypothetical protein
MSTKPEELVQESAPTVAEAAPIKKDRKKRKTKEAGVEKQAAEPPAKALDKPGEQETKKRRSKKDVKDSKTAPQEGGGVPAEDDKDAGKSRTFTVWKVVKDGKETDHKGGRYSSTSPSSAARKSANLVCKRYGEGRQEINIYMQETTKGSAKKTYPYHATRTKVDEKDVSFKTASGDAVKVPFKYQMIVKTLREKEPESAKPAVAGTEVPAA